MNMSDNPPLVVVGGGTAGLAFIVEFVQHSSRPIVLFEPGPTVASTQSRRFFDALTDPFLQRNYEAVMVDGGALVPYLQARAFGGGSAINGMLNDRETAVTAAYFASDVEIGPMARALFKVGGSPAPLAWHGDARENDVAGVRELISSGRVRHVQENVDALMVGGDEVTGVIAKGETTNACHVVLASGVFQSVSLLMTSLDDPEKWKIGQNISDHPCVTATLELMDSSPISSFDAAAYLMLDNSTSPAAVIAYERASSTEPLLGLLSVVLFSPSSCGSFQLLNNSWVPHLNMLSTSSEREAMRGAVRQLTRITGNEEFARLARNVWVGTSSAPPQIIDAMTDGELDEWILHNLSPVSHISGGCTQVARAIPGLTVADSSALGHVPHGFPNNSVREFARKVGQELGGNL